MLAVPVRTGGSSWATTREGMLGDRDAVFDMVRAAAVFGPSALGEHPSHPHDRPNFN